MATNLRKELIDYIKIAPQPVLLQKISEYFRVTDFLIAEAMRGYGIIDELKIIQTSVGYFLEDTNDYKNWRRVTTYCNTIDEAFRLKHLGFNDIRYQAIVTNTMDYVVLKELGVRFNWMYATVQRISYAS